MMNVLTFGTHRDSTLWMALVLLLAVNPGWTSESTELDELQRTVERLEQALEATRDQVEALSQSRELGHRLPEPGTRNLFADTLSHKRPMLGVVLSSDDSGTGIRLAAVTPGGPAERAGLQAGDRLTAINGTMLDSDSGIATLHSILDQSHAEDRCSIDFIRDGEPMSTEVTLELMTPGFGLLDGRIKPLVFGPDRDSFAYGFQMGPNESLKQLEGLLNRFEPMDLDQLRQGSGRGDLFPKGFRFTRPITGLELKALNQDLAAYFHTTDGVLVLASERPDSPIKAGDVIREIDGEPVTTPYEVLEHLNRVDPGETAQLSLIRHAVPMTIQIEGLSLADRLGQGYSWQFETHSEPDSKASK